MYEHRSVPLLPSRKFVHRMAWHLGAACALVGISLVVGMVGYVWLAHMPWVDAFLNASMLLGGMGPVGDLSGNPAKIFAGVYALYAGLVFIVSAGVIIAPVAHRIFHTMHLDETEGRRTRTRSSPDPHP